MSLNNNELPEQFKDEILSIASKINEIINNYKKLRNPLLESQKKVPRTTAHLDKINEQTEAITQTMLDTVERVTVREDNLIVGLNKIKDELSSNDAHGIQPEIDKMIETATDNSDDIFSLMESLQFQDITSQQINSAVVMLEELEFKLNNILTVMNGEESSISDANQKRKQRAFNPHAEITNQEANQKDIDSIFAKK